MSSVYHQFGNMLLSFKLSTEMYFAGSQVQWMESYELFLHSSKSCCIPLPVPKGWYIFLGIWVFSCRCKNHLTPREQAIRLLVFRGSGNQKNGQQQWWSQSTSQCSFFGWRKVKFIYSLSLFWTLAIKCVKYTYMSSMMLPTRKSCLLFDVK